MKKPIKALLSLAMIASCSLIPFPASNEYTMLDMIYVNAYAASTLSAPKNIYTSSTADTITIKWSKISSADAYRVYMYDAAQKKYVVYKNIAGNACQISDLTANTTYYFKVAALTKSGSKYKEHECSDQITIKTKYKLPAAPSSDYTGFGTANNNKYYFENGKAVTGFKKIGSDYYYFTDTGMLTGWLNFYEKYYYFYSDGKMAANVKLKIGGESYEFKGDGKVAWYTTTAEPKAKYTITGEKPDFSIWMSDETDYTSVVVSAFTNNSSKDIEVCRVGELFDDDYSDFDRVIGLFDFKSPNDIQLKNQTVSPGKTEYLSWVCVSDDTWYDRKTEIKFMINYDNVTYYVYTSNYYGTHYEPAHFDFS